MLRELIEALGGQKPVADLLSVHNVTIRYWVAGRKPNAGTRKCIWLVWALILHPGKVQTAFDIATCGIGRPD